MTDRTEQLGVEHARRIRQGMQESGAEGLTEEHAAAALFDAIIRGYACDTGELAEDL